jgi:hypothetical protein
VVRFLGMGSTESPDWVAEAWFQTRKEVAAFLSTTRHFFRHPFRFGRRWPFHGGDEQNPLGYAATSLAVVAVIAALMRTLARGGAEDTSVGQEFLSWILPYGYFFLLGAAQHVCLRLLGSRRPLRDSLAMTVYAGAGTALPTMAASLVSDIVVRLASDPRAMDRLPPWIAPMMITLAFALAALLFATMAASQAGVHGARLWKVVVAMAVSLVLTGFLFGAFHPPGRYGLHLTLGFTSSARGFGFSFGLGD